MKEISKKSQSEQASEIMIPIPLTLALKLSREHRILRKIVISYIRANKLPGFENLGKDLPVDNNHSARYDSKGRLIAKLTPEEIAENNKPQELASPVKQYSLDELSLLKVAAKKESDIK